MRLGRASHQAATTEVRGSNTAHLLALNHRQSLPQQNLWELYQNEQSSNGCCGARKSAMMRMNEKRAIRAPQEHTLLEVASATAARAVLRKAKNFREARVSQPLSLIIKSQRRRREPELEHVFFQASGRQVAEESHATAWRGATILSSTRMLFISETCHSRTAECHIWNGVGALSCLQPCRAHCSNDYVHLFC